jgi:hypothetical protein
MAKEIKFTLKKDLSTLDKNILVYLKNNGGQCAAMHIHRDVAHDLNDQMFSMYIRGLQKRLGGVKENGSKDWRLKMIDQPENEPLRPETQIALSTELYATLLTF